jgi:hypothetical protein
MVRKPPRLRQCKINLFRRNGARAVRTRRRYKGANPADVPIVQSIKFEFVINVKTQRPSVSKCRQCCLPAPTR